MSIKSQHIKTEQQLHSLEPNLDKIQIIIKHDQVKFNVIQIQSYDNPFTKPWIDR